MSTTASAAKPINAADAQRRTGHGAPAVRWVNHTVAI